MRKLVLAEIERQVVVDECIVDLETGHPGYMNRRGHVEREAHFTALHVMSQGEGRNTVAQRYTCNTRE